MSARRANESLVMQVKRLYSPLQLFSIRGTRWNARTMPHGSSRVFTWF